MGVIVDYGDAARFAFELETAGRALEARQGLGRCGHLGAKHVTGGQSGQGIAHVMGTRHAQALPAHALLGHAPPAVAPEVEARPALGRGPHAAGRPVQRGQPTRDRVRSQGLLDAVVRGLGQAQSVRPRVVATDDQALRIRHLGGELLEYRRVVVWAWVDVGVVPLDIRDHREIWRERKEHPIVLVGLDHERGGGVAPGSVAAEVGHLGADQVAAGHARAAQGHGDHRASGGLAVSTGHSDHRALLRPLAPQVGAAKHRDARRASRRELHVLGAHGSSSEHGVGAGNVGRAMAKLHTGPARHEGGGKPVGGLVGAAHRVALVEQKACDGAHPAAGDADDVVMHPRVSRPSGSKRPPGQS